MRHLPVLLLLPLVGTAAHGASAVSLYSRSDVIVLGSVSSVKLGQPDVSFQIDVESPIKGVALPHSLLDVRCASAYGSGYGNGVIKDSLRGIWFLSQNPGESNFRCIIPNGGQPAPIFNLLLPVGALVAKEKVLQPSSGDSPVETIVKLVATAIEQGNPRIPLFRDAAFGLDTPAVTAILRYFSQSADLNKRAAGVAGLIDRDDQAVLLDFLKNWKGFSETQVNVISAALKYRGQGSEVIQAVGSVLTDPSCPPVLAHATAYWLREARSKEALPYLVRSLGSPDPEVQGQAVFGLSNYVYGSGPVEAGTDRHTYLMGSDRAIVQRVTTFWKDWWTAHRSELQ
jgi:hypothetical protein